MKMDGKNAFPSIETLAAETGLTTRSVGQHLKKAEHEGWITRKKHRGKGKDWAQYHYVATIPDRQYGAERSSGANSSRPEYQGEGRESRNTSHQNDVPTNSTGNSISNSNSSESGEASEGRMQFKKLLEKMQGRVKPNAGR